MMATFGVNWETQEFPGDIPTVQLWYPGCEGNATEIEIELSSVRAADGLRISFDFGRNGYVIKQASTFSWEVDDEVCDMDWQEVAFIPAWGREKPEPE